MIAAVNSLTTLLGGAVDEGRWHTFDDFTYFQHFTLDQIKNGIYSRLAFMQGHDATFYVGGATDFELVEPIVVHSKYLVAKHSAVPHPEPQEYRRRIPSERPRIAVMIPPVLIPWSRLRCPRNILRSTTTSPTSGASLKDACPQTSSRAAPLWRSVEERSAAPAGTGG